MNQEFLRITTIACEACGKPLAFEGCGEYICPDCGHKQLDDFGKVRVFLEKNPGASLVGTSTATGVSVGRIRQFIADDRLEIIGNRYL